METDKLGQLARRFREKLEQATQKLRHTATTEPTASSNTPTKQMASITSGAKKSQVSPEPNPERVAAPMTEMKSPAGLESNELHEVSPATTASNEVPALEHSPQKTKSPIVKRLDFQNTAASKPSPYSPIKPKTAGHVAPSAPQSTRTPKKQQPAASPLQRGSTLSPPSKTNSPRETPVSPPSKAQSTASPVAQHRRPPMSPPRSSDPSSAPLQKSQQQKNSPYAASVARTVSRTSPTAARQGARDLVPHDTTPPSRITFQGRAPTPVRNANNVEANLKKAVASLEAAHLAENGAKNDLIQKLQQDLAESQAQTKQALDALEKAKHAAEMSETQPLQKIEQAEEAGAADADPNAKEPSDAEDDTVQSLRAMLVEAQEEKRELENKIAELEQTVAHHEEKISELTNENAAFKSSSEKDKAQVASLARRIEKLKIDVRTNLEAAQALPLLRNQNAELLKRANNQQRSKTSSATEAALRRQRDKNEADLRKEREEHDQLIKEAEAREALVKELKAELTRVEREKDDVTLILRAIQKEPRAREAPLLDQIYKLQAKVQELTIDANMSKAQVKKLETQLDSVTRQGAGPSNETGENRGTRAFGVRVAASRCTNEKRLVLAMTPCLQRL